MSEAGGRVSCGGAGGDWVEESAAGCVVTVADGTGCGVEGGAGCFWAMMK